ADLGDICVPHLAHRTLHNSATLLSGESFGVPILTISVCPLVSLSTTLQTAHRHGETSPVAIVLNIPCFTSVLSTKRHTHTHTHTHSNTHTLTHTHIVVFPLCLGRSGARSTWPNF